jgi:restriction system protein
MSIPDFQTIMLPFLEFAQDKKEHSTTEALEKLSEKFKLTKEELNTFLPSGNQKIFYNRVFWTKAYLKMAGLIENTKRAHFKITERGIEALKSKPDKINLKFLRQYPDFREMQENWKKEREDDETVNIEISTSQTPEEALENNYQKIRKTLSQELLTKIKKCSPQFFEKLVIDLLVKMGYGGSIREMGEVIGKPGDEGIDGIIKEDKLGLDIIYVQAKRWENPVSRPEIQKFVGALAGQGAKKGIFITTGKLTSEAQSFKPQNETKIVAIDGEQLTQYMIDYNLGLSSTMVYEIKKIDTDYFEEEE